MNSKLYYAAKSSLSLKEQFRYFSQSIYSSINESYRAKDEWGICRNCGNFTRFTYSKMLDLNSKIVTSCGWDEKFTEEINITNTLNCLCCHAKFRVRCAAQSLLKSCWQGKFRCVSELVDYFEAKNPDWIALETASVGGIFSEYTKLKNIIKSEYYDDIERGKYKNGVRSEDLQNLTFDDNTFDAIISLDVFEHIADPWEAFSEVHRVIKPGGVGIITVPIDIRIKTTKTLAKAENGEIKYFRKPAYHGDPIREEGALVFTEFGTDIVNKLKEMGHNASFEIYKTRRTNVTQFAIVIKK
jgi:hypothetical protein